MLISIHAPQWGATLSAIVFDGSTKFQSTHPSGVRPPRNAPRSRARKFQSTHPSGVRPWCSTRSSTPSGFQSTHPSGVRLLNLRSWAATESFQSTHPSGVRLQLFPQNARRHNFNPRTPVGCDGRRLSGAPGLGRISIHAPQWGATERHANDAFGHVISIHAPQWGATGRHHCNGANPVDFNPRTPVGCDL